MTLLMLVVASTSIFFISQVVDQIFIQQQQLQQLQQHQQHEESQQKQTQHVDDIYETVAKEIATLLRSLADPDVDATVLKGGVCDPKQRPKNPYKMDNNNKDLKITNDNNSAPNSAPPPLLLITPTSTIPTSLTHTTTTTTTTTTTDDDDDDVNFNYSIDRLNCMGQLLKDYSSELITLGSMPLMPNEKLTSIFISLMAKLGKKREPPNRPPSERERELSLKRINIHSESKKGPLPAWKNFQNRISNQALFLNEDRENIEQLLKDLRDLEIAEIEEIPDLGTQIKFILVFQDGGRALFKPMRVPRDRDETMDIYYMYEKERHTAEIAAFHLNRILGFNTVPPVAGRYFNMTEDIYPLLTEDVQDHFFYSPVDNICFFGQCDYFCDAANSVCGVGTRLEGSVAAFLPDRDLADWRSISNPWKRSYSKYNKSEWETTDDPEGYCDEVRMSPPFDQDKAILNVIDSAIFDFLTGNKDRHHYYTFVGHGNDSYYMLFDNGKGFGRAHDDIIDILAPLYQCCLIRYTTLRTLVQLHTDPHRKLSQLMKESLSRDVLPDILTPAHLRALDRRVRIILEQILRCLKARGESQNIIVDDGFYYERG